VLVACSHFDFHANIVFGEPDTRPAPVAIAEQRKLQQVLVAARSGDEDFAPLPGTRYEVQALAQLFSQKAKPRRDRTPLEPFIACMTAWDVALLSWSKAV
jgi:hypothetical protein